ncbi:ATP-binding cassette domain-containing protein [Streptomyces sp. NPDC055607]
MTPSTAPGPGPRPSSAPILLALSSLCAAAASLALPYVVSRTLDASLTGRDARGPLWALGSLVFACAVAEYAAAVSAAGASAASTVRLRRSLVRKAMDMGLRGQRAFPAADIASRVVGGADEAAAIAPAVIGVAVSWLLSLGGLVGLALLDWRLPVALVLGLVPAVFLIRRFLSRATGASVRYQQHQADLVVRLTEALAGARTIRAAGTARREAERVLRPLPRMSATGRENWALQARLAWQAGLLLPLVEVAVLATAGLGVAGGRLSPGGFLAAAAYAGMAMSGLGALDALGEIAHCRAGARRVAEVLNAPVPAVVPGTSAGAPATGADGLVLRGVTVAGALDGIDLSLPAGTTAALVGGTGAGKSVLAAVAGGLLVPDGGEVLLDGVPLGGADPRTRSAVVAYAFDRPRLLGRTLAEALGGGDGVPRAARMARADGFVERLPHGFATPPEHLRLSGGEMQRLGLARAFNGDPRLLVLDDALSSLDTATEALIDAAVSAYAVGRTVLTVARRPAAAAAADVVVWLEDGRLVACAPHAELWERPSYRSVFERAAA